jgi:TonB family protein
MGVRSSAEYDFWEKDEQEGAGQGPENRVMNAATNPATITHNEGISLVHGRPLSPEHSSEDRAIPSNRASNEPAANMADELLTTQQTRSGFRSTEGHELDSFLGKSFEEKPIWSDLWENIQDVFFPKKLPPLQLTSTPIPVPDRMAVKTNPWAVGTATFINGAILLLVLYLGARAVINKIIPPHQVTNIDVGDINLSAPKSAQTAGGGGGGGSHDIVDPIKGKLPKLDKAPVTPPMVPILEKPKLEVPSAIMVQPDIKLPDNPNMPMIGVTNSANVTLASNGQGTGSGMGTGSGGGLGSGTGNGWGPGTGGNAGGGLFRIGGGVSAPVPIVSPEAEFSDEARRAKYQGVCLVSLIVDAQGNPQNPRVIRALGMGLDEKALEAVRRYKFKPALKDGKTPVPVMITIEVNFRLY